MPFDSITLTNFKSVKSLALKLTPLTILTGLNGSGKSSVLQAIALIKQSLEAAPEGDRLFLRGPWVDLGRSEDVLFEGENADILEFSLDGVGVSSSWTCDAPTGQDTLKASFRGSASNLRQAFSRFQFIQADRLTPAIQYQQASSDMRASGSLGPHGEYTVDYLSRNEELRVSDARHYPLHRRSPAMRDLVAQFASTDRLWDVTAAWLQLLSPGVRPLARPVDQTDSSSLRFAYKGYKTIERDIASREHRPSNVGFGLTYCLPIVVACLSAPPGSLLLLENPEAHLHPRGQSALGLLLALCAQDGVQIIVETHSDHLLNGVRVAVKRKDLKDPAAVAVHYFSRDIETGISSCTSPAMSGSGRFSHWPEGFFDEWDIALDELLGD